MPPFAKGSKIVYVGQTNKLKLLKQVAYWRVTCADSSLYCR